MTPVAPPPAALGPTLIDRVVTWLNPRAGFERHRARVLLNATGYGGYTGGRRDRRAMRNWRPREASADTDILPDLSDLRARSRDLARNSPVATGALATAVTNVVGEGLQLQPAPDFAALGMTKQQAAEWGKLAKREWWNFCRSCDFSRVQPFDELQALAFRGALDSGDVFVLRRYRKDDGDVYGTKLQVIEADRVSNPDRRADDDAIAGGVEVDGDGAPVAYHVTDRHHGAIRGGKLNWRRVPARSPGGLPRVIHLYDRLRPEQTRGVPYLAPVIEHLAQISRYAEAEVAGAVMSAMIVAFTKTTSSGQTAPLLGETQEADGSPADVEPNEFKLGAAAQIRLHPNEEVQFPALTRPNPQFDPFMTAFLRQIGVALEIPYELLVKHFTASYSASRAALEMAWQFFRRRRAWLAQRLCQTVYEWMVDEAVTLGRLPAPPNYFSDPLVRQAYCGANWIGPNRASVDPKKEAEADEIDLRNRLKSRAQIKYERVGGEIEDTIAELGEEERMIEQAGLAPAAPAAASPPGEAGDADERGDADTETPERRSNA